jgi:hypothetical protein
MKTKLFLVGFGTLLLFSAWAGRLAWRVHHQLVSLDVRNMPLREVLRKIERQTWTRLRAEGALDARITLHVSNLPLTNVLDRIAEQAGARWSALYAVYDSGKALQTLDTALRGNGQLETVGWSKIAPDLPSPGEVGPAPGASAPVLRREAGPDASGPEGPPRHMMMARRGPGGAFVFMGGPNGQMEIWSPAELLIPTPLKEQIGNQPQLSATPQAAVDLAHQVHGKWTTYLAFRKSSMGVGFRMPPPRPGLGQPFRPPDPNERFANLTPAQRVQRARERNGLLK